MALGFEFKVVITDNHAVVIVTLWGIALDCIDLCGCVRVDSRIQLWLRLNLGWWH